MPTPADWRLPVGVSRGVWDYTHDRAVADRYDADLAGGPISPAEHDLLFGNLDSSKLVLDLGCGTGRTAIPLAAHGLNVIGLDLSEPMLETARKKAGDTGPAWVCGNAVQLPFADRTFDAITCLFSTLGMIDGARARRDTLSECQRVLRPGGLMLLHVHNLWHHLGTKAGRTLLTEDFWKQIMRKPTRGDFAMPGREGLPAWTIHLFTWREVKSLLESTGFSVLQRMAIDTNGEERARWQVGPAYGFHVVAQRN